MHFSPLIDNSVQQAAQLFAILLNTKKLKIVEDDIFNVLVQIPTRVQRPKQPAITGERNNINKQKSCKTFNLLPKNLHKLNMIWNFRMLITRSKSSFCNMRQRIYLKNPKYRGTLLCMHWLVPHRPTPGLLRTVHTLHWLVPHRPRPSQDFAYIGLPLTDQTTRPRPSPVVHHYYSRIWSLTWI